MPPPLVTLLARITAGKSSRSYRPGEAVFLQGDAADAVFYLERGKVALTVVSAQGKEALVGSLGRRTFFGEGCLARQPLRMSSVRTLEASTILRVDRQAMATLLHREPQLRKVFIAHLLSRSIRIEKDLIAQLFNSSEKRLARALLRLARFGRTSKPEMVMPKVTQKALAASVGTPRSKVGQFMKRFHKLGFIDYAGGVVRVHRGLLSVLLSD